MEINGAGVDLWGYLVGKFRQNLVGGGISTRGPWAGPTNAARNEETQPDFLPALKWQYEVDKQQQN